MYTKPATTFNKDLLAKYNKNIFSVMEEVWASDTERIDLVVFLNGFAIMSFELKCNFAGQSYTRISTDEVQNQRFKITAKYEYNNKVNVGYIISQSIEEGQQVPYGTELVLTVSKGTEYIDIPDVSGKDYADAEKTLTDAGFTVKKVEKSNDGTHQAGKVIASTPSAGTSAESGSEVYLQVWGAAPTTTSASTTKSSNGFGIDKRYLLIQIYMRLK